MGAKGHWSLLLSIEKPMRTSKNKYINILCTDFFKHWGKSLQTYVRKLSLLQYIIHGNVIERKIFWFTEHTEEYRYAYLELIYKNCRCIIMDYTTKILNRCLRRYEGKRSPPRIKERTNNSQLELVTEDYLSCFILLSYIEVSDLPFSFRNPKEETRRKNLDEGTLFGRQYLQVVEIPPRVNFSLPPEGGCRYIHFFWSQGQFGSRLTSGSVVEMMFEYSGTRFWWVDGSNR